MAQGQRNPGRWFTELCAGIAAVTLAFALGLGVWGLTADTVHVPSEVARLGSYQDPVRLAWIAVAVAAALLILLVAVTIVRSGFLAVVVAVAACAAALYFVASTYDVITTLQMMSANSVRSAQLPAASTAWFLAAVGSVATVLGAAPLSPRPRIISAPLVIAVIIALVGSTSAVWVAVRAGDDARFVEASQAGVVGVQEVPAVLGERAFSRKIADRTEIETAVDGSAVSVAAAGPGFVLLHDGTVTAYDSDGGYRWHYRRTGPADLRIGGANVYDNGRTIIGRIDGPDPVALVALDAMTGRLLWTSTEATRLSAFGAGSNMWPLAQSLTPSRFLIARGQQQWAAFDTRTGAELWSIEAPRHCRRPDSYITRDVSQVAAAVLLVTQCSADGGGIDVTASVLNPITGGQTASTPIADRVAVREQGREYLDVSITDAGRDGAVFAIGAESGDLTGYLGADGAVTHPNLARYSLVRSNDPDPDFLAVVSGTDGVHAVFGPDGRFRCRLPQVADQSISNRDLTWLGDEFVAVVSTTTTSGDFDQVLQSFDRRTCTPAHRADLPWGSVRGTGAVPGLFLVLRTDDQGTFLDGYR